MCATNLWRHIILGLEIPILLGTWSPQLKRYKTVQKHFWSIFDKNIQKTLIFEVQRVYYWTAQHSKACVDEIKTQDP